MDNTHAALVELDKLSCARLDFDIDASRLLNEFQAVDAEAWQAYANITDPDILPVSGWHAISLTSSTGHYADDWSKRTANMEDCNVPTEIAAQLPFMTELIMHFSPATRCRLYRLEAGAVIEDHRDENLMEYKLARLLIPIVADPGCITTIDRSEQFYLRPGECWFMNDGRLHRVENNSQADRLVLLIQTYDVEKVLGLVNDFKARQLTPSI